MKPKLQPSGCITVNGSKSLADSLPITKREKRDIKHASDPKPGDYWSENFVPVCVVLDVTVRFVIYCKKTRDTSERTWTWDLTKVKVKTKAGFRRWLEYKTMSNNFWATCSPRAHCWAAKAVKK